MLSRYIFKVVYGYCPHMLKVCITSLEPLSCSEYQFPGNCTEICSQMILRELPYTEHIVFLGMDTLKLQHQTTDLVAPTRLSTIFPTTILGTFLNSICLIFVDILAKSKDNTAFMIFQKAFFKLRITEAWNKLLRSVVSCQDRPGLKISMLHQEYIWYHTLLSVF